MKNMSEEKKQFLHDGSIYRVNPLDENSIVERQTKDGWESTKIKWKDYNWGSNHSIGLGSGSLRLNKNYHKG